MRDEAGEGAMVFCLRCGCALEPGRSDLYIVRIESYADPTPPSVTSQELQARDFEKEMAELIEQMKQRSAQEHFDDVYRCMTLHLCGPCYRGWIENPVG